MDLPSPSTCYMLKFRETVCDYAKWIQVVVQDAIQCRAFVKT
jgi:hypothetical protein